MRCRKNGGKIKKTAILGLTAALVVGGVGLKAAATGVPEDTESDAKENNASAYDAEEYSSERIGTNYNVMSSKYTLSDYTGEAVSFAIADVVTDEGKEALTQETKEYQNSSEVLNLTSGDKAKLKLNVPSDGLYYLNFDYLSYDESILPVSLTLKVDGEYPFYECRNMEFETTWKLSEEPSYVIIQMVI